MLRTISIFITLLNVFTFISFSQNQTADEYQPPEVIEGSNLTVVAYPDVSLTKRKESEFDSRFSYYLHLMSDYTKWRYTDRLDYAFSTEIGTSVMKSSYYSNYDVYSNAQFNFQGGASYYFLKNKLFAGEYSTISARFEKGSKPYYNINLYPNIGYGKITDAFIVNETSNFEKVLSDENYIDKPFGKKARAILNSILDRKNGNVFSSLFKDDAEIEFFTELEKILLEEKIISKPLNARTTMKLFQSLYDRQFILFPLYKGYQFQAEFDYRNSNYDDTIKYPLTLSLNAVYGLPLNNKTSMLFSAHYVFPVNNNYNIDFFSANMHNPAFIRSVNMNISNYGFLDQRYMYLYHGLYDYKASAVFNIFHYLNRTAGVTGRITYIMGNQKSPERKVDYSVDASAELVLSIINKLRITTGVEYFYNSRYEYNFAFGGRISYNIF